MRDLGDNHFLMLRNHGLLTVAESIPDMFMFMCFFEAACLIQVRAQGSGNELRPIDPPIIAGAKAQAKAVTRGPEARSPSPVCCASWTGRLRTSSGSEKGVRSWAVSMARREQTATSPRPRCVPSRVSPPKRREFAMRQGVSLPGSPLRCSFQSSSGFGMQPS